MGGSQNGNEGKLYIYCGLTHLSFSTTDSHIYIYVSIDQPPSSLFQYSLKKTDFSWVFFFSLLTSLFHLFLANSTLFPFSSKILSFPHGPLANHEILTPLPRERLGCVFSYYHNPVLSHKF